jgi:hypothetical protein
MPVATIYRHEMDVVRSDHEVQYLQAITLSCLKWPILPPLPISSELKQKLLLVAAMSDMPDLPGNIIAIRPWHFSLDAHF